MIPFAALTGPLPKLGVVVVALLAAGTLLARTRRTRALAMLGALVLSPLLLLTDIWDSPQLHLVHRHPLYALVGGIIALGVLAAAARLIALHPTVLAPLAVVALPFRVPIQAGGTTSNLLVPLYLVVAAGALAWIVPTLRADDEQAVIEPDSSGGWAVWVQRLLALFVVLYGVQSIYSSSFEIALQQMVFFYVPFTLLYRLLRSIRWTREMIALCLKLTIALALVFSAIGFVEYATKTIILNPKLVVANDLHTYFTVNSVFFDPDIFGRYLALSMVLLAVLLLYNRPQREQLIAVAALAVLWAALVPDAVAVEPRRPAGRPGGVGGIAMEAVTGVGGGGRRDRAGRRRGRGDAAHIWSQPGRQRRLERSRRARQRRAVAVRRPSRVGLGVGVVREGVPRPSPRDRDHAVGIAHDSGHGRSRAGPDR